MTVTTNDSPLTYPGNDTAVAFPGPRAFSVSDLVVEKITAGIAVVLSYPADYTVTGVGGSSTTVTLTGAPVASGTDLVIKRVLPVTQPTSFKNQGAFFPENHENAFDRLTMLIEQVVAGIGTSLQLVDGDVDGFGRYDANGNRIINLAAGIDGNDATNLTQMNAAIAEVVADAAAAGAAAGAAAIGNTALWVDPASGNDAHAGTFALPKKTVASVVTTFAATGGIIRLVAGAVVKESINLTGLKGIHIIGNEGVPTIIDCTDPIVGTWVAVGGYTNLWSLNVTHGWTALGARGYPNVIEVDATARKTTRINLVSYGMNTANQMAGVVDAATAKTWCDTHLGSVFVSPDQYTAGYAAGVFTYYMSTPDGSNPNTNGRSYRFANRQAPQLGIGNSLHNCIVIGGWEHNGIVADKACFLNRVTVWYPANHATELPGCVTYRLKIKGSNINGNTVYAFHHYCLSSNAFDYTLHIEPELQDWTGQFASAIGCHTSDSTPSIAKLIFFDRAKFDNVDNIAGGNTVDLVYLRNLVGTRIGNLGTPSCDYTFENPILHIWNAEALSPPLDSAKTLTINGGRITCESQAIGSHLANSGTLILDGTYVAQLGTDVNNTWCRTIASLAKIYIRNGCVIDAPLGSGMGKIGTTISGGASSSAVAITGSLLGTALSVPTTWMPDGTTMWPHGTNIKCDPKITKADDEGVTLAFDGPYHYRSRAVRAVAAPVSNLQPHVVMTLTSKDIVVMNANLGLFTNTPVYTPASPLNLNRLTYVGDTTNQWHIAYGEGGVLHKGKSAIGSWSQVTNARTTNYTCAAAKTTAGAAIATLGGRDGTLTSYDPVTDTFATITSPTAAALYDGFFTGTGAARWVFVGAGVILTSPDNITYTLATGITGTDNIRRVIGAGNYWVAVCDASVIYYSTDNTATWNRIVLNWGIDFRDVAVNTNTNDFVAVGDPLNGHIAAYKSNISDLTTWTQLTTPLSTIREVVWVKDYFITSGSYTMTAWIIAGTAYRLYYTQDLTGGWTADNPWPNDGKPTATYAEDALMAAVMQTL